MTEPLADAAAVEAFTRRMFTRIIAGLARTLREEELSIAQVAVLHLLDERGTMRATELVLELERSAPAVSRLLDDLVKRKLVVRREDEVDRRAKVISLAPKGRALVGRVGEARVRDIFRAAAAMPDSPIRNVLASFPRKP